MSEPSELTIQSWMKVCNMTREEAMLAIRGSHTNAANDQDYADDAKTVNPNSAFQWL
jgi:hypothetical protein